MNSDAKTKDTVSVEEKTPYDYTYTVAYNNDFEYRACLRKLFCMILPNDTDATIDDDIDEVTRDELNFDQTACDTSMTFVYDKTIHHPLFQRLYDTSAAFMISTDRSIGLSVLFSYDYLKLFHNCLNAFFVNPETFDENSPAFTRLWKKLT
jgi:hypothetical protein